MTFSDITLDHMREQAKQHYNELLAYLPDLSDDERYELRQDIIQGYIEPNKLYND